MSTHAKSFMFGLCAAVCFPATALASPALASPKTPVTAFAVTTKRTAVPSQGAIVEGPDGQEWFTTFDGSSYGVDRITAKGAVYEVTGLVAGAPYPAIVRGPEDAVWLTGHRLSEIKAGGNQVVFTHSGSRGNDLVDGPNGDLYATDNAGTIDQFAVSGHNAVLTQRPVPSRVTPEAIASVAGALWFSDLTGALFSMTTSGTVRRTHLRAHTVSTGPHTLTPGPGHDLWAIADGPGGYGDSVLRISPSSGRLLKTYYRGLPASARLTSIVADSNGRVWFPEAGANALGTLDAATGKINNVPLPPGFKLPNPRRSSFAIATGASGAIWFTLETARGYAAVAELPHADRTALVPPPHQRASRPRS